ncbi:MAG: transporter substrate-binding domain-containing protein, partial [Alphaproteobacteria bacterium]|nr:transporter substrate-binding domain-containing protein [Alphaproteobacteria bacterium]
MNLKLRNYPKVVACVCMMMSTGYYISNVAANKPVATTPVEEKIEGEKPTDTHPQDNAPQNGILPITDKKLSIGWFNLDPYYTLRKSEGGVEHLTGLDTELVKAIAKTAGYNADYSFIQWGNQIQNLKEGKQHMASSATFTQERSQFVYFSDPYRREENSFYTRKGSGSKFSFISGDMNGFVESLKKNKSKIALLEGMVFASPEINKFVEDPENKQYFVFTKNVYESIDLLLRGGVDGFLDDRIVSSTAIWRTQNSD